MINLSIGHQHRKSMNKSIDSICQDLRVKLEESVKRNLAEGILLSGGLDTSILATIASKYVKLRAFTGTIASVDAPDIRYAKLIANRLGLKHTICYFDEEEVYDAIPFVIGSLRSFDPMQIRGGVTVYICLKLMKESGIDSIITGDGSDELFAGYPHFIELSKNQLDRELKFFFATMDRINFMSLELANSMGMTVKLPYLDPEFKSFAGQIDPELKVRARKSLFWGKWILRKAFESILPSEIIWRMKMPVELGSGTAILIYMLNSTISEVEFEEKRQRYLAEDRVVIRSREHLFYYETYRSMIGVPHPSKEGRICPYCNSNLDAWSSYCRTCGGFGHR